jgi:glucose-1-phosphate thymidylyltransferase
MLAGIKDILIISTPKDLPNFERLLGNGQQLGIKLSYAVQPYPEGLAQAFIIGEDFIGDDDVCMVLGDNIFYGAGLKKLLDNAVHTVEKDNKSVIFGYYVDDPQRYGVAEFDSNNSVISIEEKPTNPKSNYAVVGLYFYPNSVIDVAKAVKPSARGELEITSVNQLYLDKKQLKLEILSRGYAWLDTGTHEAMADATEFVKAVEKRTSLKIGCIEEIALRMEYIDKIKLEKIVEGYGKSIYADYLKMLLN